MTATNAAHYIPGPAYSAMIERLAEAHEAGSPMDHIRETVGQYANVWPEDLLSDPEAETSTEERFAAAAIRIGDTVAGDRHYRDPEARLDLVTAIIDGCSSLSPAARSEITFRIRNHFAAQQAAADQERRSA